MEKEIKTFDHVINYIAIDIRRILGDLDDQYKVKIEEIRLRHGRPLNINFHGIDYFLGEDKSIRKDPRRAYIVKKSDIYNSFQLITNHSVYAYSEDIKKGFITILGGHRIGIAGKIIYGDYGIENIKDISSLNIRIAREKKGISDYLLPYLIDNHSFLNTLIISPPQCGKTTLLRDMIRNLSDGSKNRQGYKIGLIDERSEIAGTYNGEAQKDVGIRTDILDGCLKSHGIMMFIRSMSPEIIAVDEIGGIKDIEAIEEALRAGIKLIATVHGHGIDEIRQRSNLRKLINEKVFERFIILSNSKGVGTVEDILSGDNFTSIYGVGD